MALHPTTAAIASTFGYTPIEGDEGEQQYQVECDFQDVPRGAIPCTGNVRKDKHGVLQCYWIPAGDNYTSEEKEDLIGWYEVPTLEEVEEWTFDSVCPTPAGDEVEPDHVDSWLTILGLI